MSIMYGFFSEEAAQMYGSFIFLDSQGNEVEVTIVYSEPLGVPYKWSDKKYVGRVVGDSIRPGRQILEDSKEQSDED